MQQLTYAQLDGTRNAATLVTPTGAGERGASGDPLPALVRAAAADVESHASSSPRRWSWRARASISLLVDTPWTKENWFPTRDAARDYEFTVQMAKDVRRALDVLLGAARRSTRRAWRVVGHDFGAMWGALAAADDPRVTHFVYMAGTRSFTDWYLFTPKKEGAEKDAFVAKLAPLDPIAHLAKISPRPVLLQFGTKDPFVKNEAATAMAEAVTGPEDGEDLRVRARADVPGAPRSDRVAEGAVQASTLKRPTGSTHQGHKGHEVHKENYN